MKNPPFKLSNQYYTYLTVENNIVLEKDNYYIFFQYKGKSKLKIEEEIEEVVIQENSFIELIPNNQIHVEVLSGLGMLLTKNKDNSFSKKNYFKIGSITKDSYQISKPWGCEYWLTGENPINDIVLKYIKINKGTKTSLQVHLNKYESNFIVNGKASVSIGLEEYSIRKEYDLKKIIINEPTVLDISPRTIHQVEAITDIDLIEASTNHLDDVIRLKDDTGRGDGKINSEHKQK